MEYRHLLLGIFYQAVEDVQEHELAIKYPAQDRNIHGDREEALEWLRKEGYGILSSSGHTLPMDTYKRWIDSGCKANMRTVGGIWRSIDLTGVT